MGLVILQMVSICMFSTFVLITACQLILEVNHSYFNAFQDYFYSYLHRTGWAGRGGRGQAGRGSGAWSCGSQFAGRTASSPKPPFSLILEGGQVGPATRRNKHDNNNNRNSDSKVTRSRSGAPPPHSDQAKLPISISMVAHPNAETT